MWGRPQANKLIKKKLLDFPFPLSKICWMEDLPSVRCPIASVVKMLKPGVENPGATGGGSRGRQHLNSESKESLLLVDS